MERISAHRGLPLWLHFGHLARYRWACKFAKGCRVIDAACGNGYGSLVLAQGGEAAQVDGFDLSPEAIEEAKALFAKSVNVGFQAADACRLPVPDHTYDLYVSFETIEHIRDDAAYLREALRVLKKGGVFICSTPNRLIVHPAATLLDRPISSYGHVREYAFEELDPLLCGCFASVDWFGQAYYGRRYCRFLKMVGQRMPRLAVRTHQIRKLLELPLRRSGFYQPRVLDTQRSPEVLVAVCRA